MIQRQCLEFKLWISVWGKNPERKKLVGVSITQVWEAFIGEWRFPCHCLDLWTASSAFPGNNIKYEVSRSVLTEGDLDEGQAPAEPVMSIQELAEWGINDLQVIRHNNEQNWDNCKQTQLEKLGCSAWTTNSRAVEAQKPERCWPGKRLWKVKAGWLPILLCL